jgi:predicted alpha/beta superfamily hydrolase
VALSFFIGCGQGQEAGQKQAPAPAAADKGDSGLSSSATVLRVHYPLAAGQTLSVRGSTSPLNWMSGVSMTQKSATDYEFRITGLTTTLQWKPLVGDSTWSIGMNYTATPGQTVDVYPHFYTTNGQYQRYYSDFHSNILDNDRGVWIYLPPSYYENTLAQYPVLYMHDGQNLFDPAASFAGVTWQVAQTLDAGSDALDPTLYIPEMVVIGPENTSERIYEYTPVPDPTEMGGGGGDLYLAFLKTELKPAIENDPLFKGRLLTDVNHTAMAGSSLGGLITAYAGITQPDVWSRLGIFSPSTWWDSDYIIGAVSMAGGVTPRWVHVYVDSGSPDDDQVDTANLAQEYRDIGYVDGSTLQYVLAPGASHDEAAWAARLPGALRFLCSDW